RRWHCGYVSAWSVYVCSFVFFFSSRRRHTRCLSDWSSDVCSSDLRHATGATSGVSAEGGAHSAQRCGGSPHEALAQATIGLCGRSEERRVGKQSRIQGARDAYERTLSTEELRIEKER